VTLSTTITWALGSFLALLPIFILVRMSGDLTRAVQLLDKLSSAQAAGGYAPPRAKQPANPAILAAIGAAAITVVMLLLGAVPTTSEPPARARAGMSDSDRRLLLEASEKAAIAGDDDAYLRELEEYQRAQRVERARKLLKVE
jgi:hypothetical protein